MRYLFGFVYVLAVCVAPLVGCSDLEDMGSAGNGGTAGDGGSGGMGGMPECESAIDCTDRNDCTDDTYQAGMCEFAPVEDGMACDESNECTVGTCAEGTCDSTPVADDTACGDDAGACQQGSCRVVCDEQGILDAIAAGGGPYTFDCDGPTVVGTTITIDNDVILDGEGNLILGRVYVTEGVTATLSGVTIQGHENSITNLGALTLANVVLTPVVSTSRQLTITDSTVSTKGHTSVVVSTSGPLTITDSTVLNNRAGLAIFSVSAGPLTITDSTVSNNNADAIFFVQGHLTMIRTTIADNESTLPLFVADGTTLIQESTVSGNLGGIVGGGHCAVTLIDSTVSGNTLNASIVGNVTVVNSTIVGSRALGTFQNIESPAIPAIRGSVISGACDVGVVSNGHNIESPGDTCGFDQGTDQVDITEGQLNLGLLADNGGPTMTHALLPGSVAIDVIPADMCEVDEDQRGVDRPQGTMCDVGAFEVQEGDL